MVSLFRRPGVDSLVKSYGLLAFIPWTLVGQEGAGAGWDPREIGGVDPDWETLLVGVLLALACGGFWRLLMWLLERNSANVKWKEVRLWWPTAMLLWGWAMLVLLVRETSSGSAVDVVFFVFGVFNLPALVAILLVLGFVDQAIHPAVWLNVFMSSLILWGGNYLLVRLAERQAWKNEPLSLHLADAACADAKDIRS